MPDVLLFGATGYTGRLTAHALARRGVAFAVAGRQQDRLEALAKETGHPETRVAGADTRALVPHLEDVKVLVTCAGPFAEIGRAVVDAALEAGVHYIDSTGESSFIAWMLRERAQRAHERTVALAPALGFEEVPADVAATIACEGLLRPDLTLTYALPSVASRGTIRSALGALTAPGQWLREGRPRSIRAGEATRWAPMPPPLGPRRAACWPLAEGLLAPLHLEVANLETYVTAGLPWRLAAAAASGPLRPVVGPARARTLLGAVAGRLVEQPGNRRDGSFTVLAEARAGRIRRHVTVTGRDPYGLTAELLAAGAARMISPEYRGRGIVAPVEAADLATWQNELQGAGAAIEVRGMEEGEGK